MVSEHAHEKDSLSKNSLNGCSIYLRDADRDFWNSSTTVSINDTITFAVFSAVEYTGITGHLHLLCNILIQQWSPLPKSAGRIYVQRHTLVALWLAKVLAQRGIFGTVVSNTLATTQLQASSFVEDYRKSYDEQQKLTP